MLLSRMTSQPFTSDELIISQDLCVGRWLSLLERSSLLLMLWGLGASSAAIPSHSFASSACLLRFVIKVAGSNNRRSLLPIDLLNVSQEI